MKRKNENIIELRRTQLTKAAYKVVSKKGYYNFTVRDIAKEAGLSTGLVHYYFKSKDDLLVTVLRVMNQNLRDYLTKALELVKDPKEKLVVFMDEAFRLVEREREYFHVLIDFWTQLNHNERMRKANVKLYQSYRAECAKIIEEGIKEKVFYDIDVQYAATMVVAFVQGLIIQYIIDPNAFNYEDYTKKIKEQILENLVIK